MIIASRSKLHSIDLDTSSKSEFIMGNEEITMVNSTKFLGLQADD